MSDDVVAYNLAERQPGRRARLFESARNLLWGNLAIGNAKSGLRVRNGRAIEVHRNAFVDNGYDGIEAYAEALGPELGTAWRLPSERRLDISLGDNLMLGNARSALNLRNPGPIDLMSERYGARRLRLGGDLRDCADEVQHRLAAWGQERIIGRGDGRRARDLQDLQVS